MIIESKTIYRCVCGAEGLTLDAETEDGVREIWINLWEHGQAETRKISLKWKIKYMWHILRRGTLHADMVILDFDTAKKFANAILAFINKK